MTQQQSELKENQLVLAEKAFDKALESLRQNNHQEAIDYYNKAIAAEHPEVAIIQSGLAEAYYALGEFKHDLGNYDKALECFREA